MPDAPNITGPSIPRKNEGLDRLRLFAGASTAAIILVVLFGIWPYQHGHYETRISVLKGLYVLVQSPIGSEWFFCLLVPFITAFLVYLGRDSLRNLAIDGSNWGIAIMVFSLALYWLGYRADSRYIGFASAQIMVGALIIWFLGWNLMRQLFFPWLFLAFTWPFPPLEEILAFPLRIFAAASSSILLNVLGVDCVRAGTAIISFGSPPSPGADPELRFQLDVANPCSGIRSLFSLIMISVFYGFVALNRIGHRAILFALAIPLAVTGNIVRMLLLAFGSLLFGTNFAIGTDDRPSTYHEISGIAVFTVALAGMFAVARLLESKAPSSKKSRTKNVRSSKQPAHEPRLISLWRSATIFALSALAMLFCYLTPASDSLSGPGVTATLPQSFGGYWGQFVPPSSGEVEQLINNGVEMSRYDYFSSTEHYARATVIVGGPEGRTIHRPEVCLPGQGWQIDGTRRISLDLGPPGSSPTDATLLTLIRQSPSADGSIISVVAYNLYWYVGHDRRAASYNEHIARSLVDSVVRNVNHRWSMVSLFHLTETNGIIDAPTEDRAIERLREVAGAVTPHILVDPKS